jgi:N-hydroxyarylamine O-acetyltransferase
MTLEVAIEEPWLADVGFGDSFVDPLRMNERGAQEQAGRTFRLVEHDAVLTVREERDGAHEAMFSFGRSPYPLDAFAERCEWMQVDTASPFVTRRICSLATQEGRITIANDRLIVTQNGRRTETPIDGESQVRRLLSEQFGISI